MSHGNAAAFNSSRFVADSIIFPKAAVLGTYTIFNGTASAVTITFYDDPTGGSASPIESVQVPPNGYAAIYPTATTQLGLSIKCSNWASIQAFVRWAPR